MKALSFLWPVLLLFFSTPSFAEDPPCRCDEPDDTKKAKQVTVDLANLIPGEVTTQTKKPGLYCFRRTHGLPETSYGTSIIAGTVFEDALVNPFSPPPNVQAEILKRAPKSPNCPTQVLAALKMATSEVQLPGLIAALLTSPPSPCTVEEVNAHVEALTTHHLEGCHQLEKQGTLDIIISSQGTTQDRNLRLTTGPGGVWRTIYGFTFVPNEDERFSTRAGEEDGTFVIEQQEDREDFDYIPSIMFHRLANRDAGKKWSQGLLTGLGYDTENVSLFAGWGWTYHENVTLTAGVAFHEQSRLVGRFDPGQILKENLTESQLVEKTYGANAYVGIAFRFNGDPHAERIRLRKENEKARKATAKETAARIEAEKKLAEQEAVCKAKAEVDRLTALTACASANSAAADGQSALDNAMNALSDTKESICEQKAVATYQVALAECKTAPAEKQQAEALAKEAKAEAERLKAEEAEAEVKIACLKSAESKEAKAKIECKPPEVDDKPLCLATAKDERSKDELKCVTDAQD